MIISSSLSNSGKIFLKFSPKIIAPIEKTTTEKMKFNGIKKLARLPMREIIASPKIP